jgi:hypothetical protein
VGRTWQRVPVESRKLPACAAAPDGGPPPNAA